MYLLYADEAGDLSDPNVRVLVVGGIAVHEDAIRPLAGEINATMNRFVGRRYAMKTEIHASPMRAGGGEWRGVSAAKRHGLAHALMRHVCEWSHVESLSGVEPFVIAMDRGHSHSPLESAYEEMLFLFDKFLREGRKRGYPHNGILVADRSKYEKTLHALVEVRRTRRRASRGNHRRLYAIAETPFFVDSRTTRLMQLADIVAHAFYRAYSVGDWSWASTLLPGVLSDPRRLVHFPAAPCSCPACAPGLEPAEAAAVRVPVAARPAS